jgi:hypothetical protein
MKEENKELLCIGGVAVILFGFLIGSLIFSVINSCQPYEVDEGYVTAKRFENGAWMNPDAYLLEINGTSEYDVGITNYNKIEIGDFVIIFFNKCLNKYIIVLIG